MVGTVERETQEVTGSEIQANKQAGKRLGVFLWEKASVSHVSASLGLVCVTLRLQIIIYLLMCTLFSCHFVYDNGSQRCYSTFNVSSTS